MRTHLLVCGGGKLGGALALLLLGELHLLHLGRKDIDGRRLHGSRVRSRRTLRIGHDHACAAAAEDHCEVADHEWVHVRRTEGSSARGRREEDKLAKAMRRGEQAREKCSRVAAQNWCGVSKFTSTASAHAALALHGVARASHPLAVRCSAVTTL